MESQDPENRQEQNDRVILDGVESRLGQIIQSPTDDSIIICTKNGDRFRFYPAAIFDLQKKGFGTAKVLGGKDLDDPNPDNIFHGVYLWDILSIELVDPTPKPPDDKPS